MLPYDSGVMARCKPRCRAFRRGLPSPRIGPFQRLIFVTLTLSRPAWYTVRVFFAVTHERFSP